MSDRELFEKRGPWIQTLHGHHWFAYSPRADEVFVDDLEALSRINRYGGHSREPYSVAEHCVRVATAMGERGHSLEAVLAGLVHDAHEAYPPFDVAAPCKQEWQEGSVGSAFAQAARELERMAARAVRENLMGAERYEKHRDVVRYFDLVLLATERRDLMAPGGVDWGELPKPLPEVIRTWTPRDAWDAWIQMYWGLRAKVAA